MPVVLEKREAGGVARPFAGTVAGGLGGNARFTMVSRGVSAPSSTNPSVWRIARERRYLPTCVG